MAPRGPSRARDYDYSNLGKAGRRTGITLKEGQIDEHGMEDLEGMFSSSPEPAVQNIANATVITSEDMDIGGSSAPDPEDVLARQRQQSRANFLLPPRSRSPMKTFLSGSPRRTPTLHSSPNARNRDVSSPIASRLAAHNASASQHRPPYRSTNLRQNHVPAAEPETESESDDHAPPQEVADFSDSGDDNDAPAEVFDNEQGNDDEGIQNNRESPQLETENAPAYDDDYSRDWDGQDDVAPEVEDDRPREPSPPAKGAKKQRGKPRTKAPPAAPKTKSRPGARKAPPVQDESDAADASEPSHRTKRVKPSKTTRGAEASTEYPQGLDKLVEDMASRNNRGKQRSLYILKREEPRDAAPRTRSGRVSVRPLAYWRNERCVYGDGGAEIGQRFPLSTIKEVIRTEEPEPEKPAKGSKRKHAKGRTGRRHDPDDPSDDEGNVNADPWETDGGGVFYGPVRRWDDDKQRAIDEDEVMDLAYAPIAVQTHPVKDATFSFAKILSTPFLGSGFVDMPPQSMKRTKNSKKMHMVFYIIHGRVQVEVSGLQFSAGKGTVFQVPRGNDYSFKNDRQKAAKLFFTQGCVASVTGTATPSGNLVSSAIPSSEAPVDHDASAPGKKTAPKRKAKPTKQSKAKR